MMGDVKLKKCLRLITAIMFITILVFCVSAVAASEQNSSTAAQNVSTNYSSDQTPHNEGPPDNLNIRGYWINNAKNELNTMNKSALKKAGITDLFVNTPKNDVEGTLTPYIDNFSDSGIRIHAWIVCFKSEGNWYDPGTNTTLKNQLINQINSISTNYAVDGIHLDYVRYPGTEGNRADQYNGTTQVTSFVKSIYNKIQLINNNPDNGDKPHILLSAALMPECSSNSGCYGQDYGNLAPYLDFMVPMIYKGNYGHSTNWIASTIRYIVNATNGITVVAGLQTYRSDNYPIPIPKAELNSDINAATTNGSAGYVLFKYGLTDAISGIPLRSTTNLAKIFAAATSLQKYVEKYEKLPSKVTLGSTQVDMPTFLYLLSKGLININNGNTGSIRLIDYNNPSNPSETVKSGSIPKKEYIKIATTIFSHMNSKGCAPNYANSNLGNVPYKNLIYAFSKIMIFYDVNDRLPSSVYVKPLSWPRIISTSPANSATWVSRTTPITITFDDKISAGTSYSQIYIKNLATGKKVAITKTISGNTLTIKTSTRSFKTAYQVYLPDGAVKNTIGNIFVKTYSLKFTTLPELVKVVKTNPTNNAVNVPVSKVFQVTFNKNIKAKTLWIELKNSKGKAVSITKSINGKVLTIKPKKKLAESKYKLILHTGCVVDQAGNQLALKSYTFGVGKPPQVTKTKPSKNAKKISLTSAITITFNKNIKTGSNYSKIYIKNLTTGKKVSITRKIKGKTLTLKMIFSRLSKNIYQVYLPAKAVKDVHGNSPVSSYPFKFKTV